MMSDKKYFKKTGFGLIEVIIAMAILSISAVSIINLQANLIKQVWQSTTSLETIFNLQNLLIDPQIQKKLFLEEARNQTFKAQQVSNLVDVNYKMIVPRSNSQLKADFDNIYLLQTSGQWSEFGKDYEISLAGLIYFKPPKEDEKKVDNVGKK